MRLRLWPGVALAILMALTRVIAPLVHPEGALIGFAALVIGGALILLWWLFLSRAPWLERLGVLPVMALATFVSFSIVHPSIRGALMGRMVPIALAVPGFALALVAATVITRNASARTRRLAIGAAIAIACGV